MKPDPAPELRPLPSGQSDEERAAELWSHVEPELEPLRVRWFLPAVLLLLLVNVPWYLPAKRAGSVLLGLPLFGWLALATSVLLAALTAFVALRYWRDSDDGGSTRT